jgi:hypothetical protein
MQGALENAKDREQQGPGSMRTGPSPHTSTTEHPILALQQQAGNQAVQQFLRGTGIQAKLAISQPDDPSEREADQVAERVVGLPSSGLVPGFSAISGATHVMRKCSCGGSDDECETCKTAREESPVQRKPQGTAAAKADVPAVVHDALSAPGQPLEGRTRAFMESRLGCDFQRVRISSDDRSARAADAIQAKAFTFGNRIVFGRNEYSPSTTAGLGLIAHELAHTAQQQSSTRPVQTSLRIGAVNDPQEREANLAADAALGGGRPPSLSAGGPAIRRQPQGNYTWEWKGDNEAVYTGAGGAKYTVTGTSKPTTTHVPMDFKPGVAFAKAYVTITWCKDPLKGSVEAGVDITNQLQQLIPQILATGNPTQVLQNANLTPYVQTVVIESEKGTVSVDVQADVGRQGVSAVRVGGSIETSKGTIEVAGGVAGLGPGEHPFPSGTVTFRPGTPPTKFKCKTTTYEYSFKCSQEEKVPGFDVSVPVTLPNPPRTRYLYFDYAHDIVTTSRTPYGKDHPNIVARNEATYADIEKDFNDGYRISAIAGFTSPEGKMPKPENFKPGMFEGNIELANERAQAALDHFALHCALRVEQACFSPSKTGVRLEGKNELYSYIDEGKEAEGKKLADVAVPEFLAKEGAGLTDKEREALKSKHGNLAQTDVIYPLLRRAEITLTKAPVPVLTKIHLGETGRMVSTGDCPAEVEQAANAEFKKRDKKSETP